MLKEHHKLPRYAIKRDGDRLGLAGYTYLWYGKINLSDFSD